MTGYRDCHKRELQKGDRVRPTKDYGNGCDCTIVRLGKNGVVEVRNPETGITTRSASFLWEKVVA